MKMIGICDSELVGKELKGDVNFLVSKKFYGHSKCDENKILKLINEAENINCIGNKIVELLVKNNIIDENKVIIINGVKHVQIYKI